MSDLVGRRGVAQLLGVDVATVATYRKRYADFPEPVMYLDDRQDIPLWTPEAIKNWDTSRPGRGVGGGRPRNDSES